MMRVTLTACSEGFNFIDEYLLIYIVSFQDLEYYLLKGEQISQKPTVGDACRQQNDTRPIGIMKVQITSVL